MMAIPYSPVDLRLCGATSLVKANLDDGLDRVVTFRGLLVKVIDRVLYSGELTIDFQLE